MYHRDRLLYYFWQLSRILNGGWILIGSYLNNDRWMLPLVWVPAPGRAGTQTMLPPVYHSPITIIPYIVIIPSYHSDHYIGRLSDSAGEHRPSVEHMRMRTKSVGGAGLELLLEQRRSLTRCS